MRLRCRANGAGKFPMTGRFALHRRTHIFSSPRHRDRAPRGREELDRAPRSGWGEDVRPRNSARESDDDRPLGPRADASWRRASRSFRSAGYRRGSPLCPSPTVSPEDAASLTATPALWTGLEHILVFPYSQGNNSIITLSKGTTEKILRKQLSRHNLPSRNAEA